MIFVKAYNKFSVQFQIIDYICSTTDFIIVWINNDGYTVSDYIGSIVRRRGYRFGVELSGGKYMRREVGEFVSCKKPNTSNCETKTQRLYK